MCSNNQINVDKFNTRDGEEFNHGDPGYNCNQNVAEENNFRLQRHLSKFPS